MLLFISVLLKLIFVAIYDLCGKMKIYADFFFYDALSYLIVCLLMALFLSREKEIQ